MDREESLFHFACLEERCRLVRREQQNSLNCGGAGLDSRLLAKRLEARGESGGSRADRDVFVTGACGSGRFTVLYWIQEIKRVLQGKRSPTRLQVAVFRVEKGGEDGGSHMLLGSRYRLNGRYAAKSATRQG